MSVTQDGPLNDAKILIAGCGDLGIRLALELGVFSTAQVTGLRRTPDATLSMPKNFQWIRGDLTQDNTLTQLPHDFTHVVFAAAPNARTPADYEAVYLRGLQQVIRACASPVLKRIVFISSTAVYSDHGDQWVDETTPTAPTHFNGKTLCAAEQWLKEYGANHHIETLSLRLSGIYGPGDTSCLIGCVWGKPQRLLATRIGSIASTSRTPPPRSSTCYRSISLPQPTL